MSIFGAIIKTLGVIVGIAGLGWLAMSAMWQGGMTTGAVLAVFFFVFVATGRLIRSSTIDEVFMYFVLVTGAIVLGGLTVIALA